MGEFLLKVHNSYRMVFAVCDKELYGQKLLEGDKQLDLTGEFFNGAEVSEEELKEEVERGLAEDATFNIVGKSSVEFFRRFGLVKDEGVLKVGEIPFALILL